MLLKKMIAMFCCILLLCSMITGTAFAFGPVDFSNKSQPGSVLYFGKVSKIHYRNGSSLSLQAGGGYSCIKPTVAMPRIVGSSGENNITEIKKFFCSEYACMMVADATGSSLLHISECLCRREWYCLPLIRM